jgi:hypothetical protein
MYPIDAIKVRCGGDMELCFPVQANGLDMVDANANSQSHSLSSLQWHDTRWLPNSHRGGNPQSMAWNVECHCWRWYVFISTFSIGDNETKVE